MRLRPLEKNLATGEAPVRYAGELFLALQVEEQCRGLRRDQRDSIPRW